MRHLRPGTLQGLSSIVDFYFASHDHISFVTNAFRPGRGGTPRGPLIHTTSLANSNESAINTKSEPKPLGPRMYRLLVGLERILGALQIGLLPLAIRRKEQIAAPPDTGRLRREPSAAGGNSGGIAPVLCPWPFHCPVQEDRRIIPRSRVILEDASSGLDRGYAEFLLIVFLGSSF
jgi:hypothetical protein